MADEETDVGLLFNDEEHRERARALQREFIEEASLLASIVKGIDNESLSLDLRLREQLLPPAGRRRCARRSSDALRSSSSQSLWLSRRSTKSV